MSATSRVLSLLAGALIGAVVLRKNESFRTEGRPGHADMEEFQKKFTEHLAAQDERLDHLRQQFEAMVASERPAGWNADLAARLAELQPAIQAMAEQVQKPDGRIDELAERISRLQPRIEALAAGLAPQPDPRVDALLARLAEVESKSIPDIRVQVADLRQALTGQEQKLQAASTDLRGQVAELRQTVSAQEQKLQAAGKVVLAIEQMLTRKMLEFDQRLQEQGRTLQAMNASIAQSDELLARVLSLMQAVSPPAPQSREPVAPLPRGSELRELQL